MTEGHHLHTLHGVEIWWGQVAPDPRETIITMIDGEFKTHGYYTATKPSMLDFDNPEDEPWFIQHHPHVTPEQYKEIAGYINTQLKLRS